jgi:hypothetical protein
MNKSALKTFATSARVELLKKVEAKAMKIGITEDNIKKADIESSDAIFIDGKQLSKEEKIQRDKLVARINQIGFKQVMEEVAYTWFNRFTALRYMEVNEYLLTGVRMLSSSNPNSAEPDMLNEALELDLEIDKEYVYELKLNSKTEELFKYLIIKHCNDLNQYLPFMFETIDDYTEILFPEGLLGKESFIRQMTNKDIIPEENWGKVEIIGWLYQYYISEKKDQVFADLKKNIKITKETLPSATQLFTPNWIVKYMVENSLGRIWLESYPESPLRSNWEYYLDEAEQEEEVIKKIEQIHYKNVNPEEITFLDPSCGSGHILVYAFDVFYDMYLEKGYIEQEIPKHILEKNLFGLDIDDRAVQLASFAVMMKAREKSRRVFDQDIKLNIVSIQESNWITNEVTDYIINSGKCQNTQSTLSDSINYLRDTFNDAKEYGSILSVDSLDFNFLDKRLKEIIDEYVDLFGMSIKSQVLEKLPLLILQTKILSKKYDVVCTNPPYMGISNGNSKLNDYVKKYYPSAKADLSTVFMEKTISMCNDQGLMAMINIPVWMSKKSFEQLRYNLLSQHTFVNMLHFGRGVFGSDFGSTAFVIKKKYILNYTSVFRQLYEELGNVDSLKKKEQWFFENKGYFEAQQNKFLSIASYPIAYWVSAKKLDILDRCKPLSYYAAPRKGLTTGDNEKFVRLWFEISALRFSVFSSKSKWFPMTKGGEFRRWYGNNEYVINWENNGFEIRNFKDENGKLRSVPRSTEYYLRECISWNDTTATGKIAFRYQTSDYIPNASGPCVYIDQNLFYYFGLLNSCVSQCMLGILAPNMKFEVGQMALVPIINKQCDAIEPIVKKLIGIAKTDWDSFEYSWDFTKHPFLHWRSGNNLLEEAYKKWSQFTFQQFEEMKSNEEEINRIFIDIYGLQEELSYKVEDKDVTLRKADLRRDVRSFISYAVGCLFGRYSLDVDGLANAGGELDAKKYQIFNADQDNILPILPGAYFEDDIVSRFIDFVQVTFGAENLPKNLEFIVNNLGKKKDETAKETIRRYFLNEFFKDHLQIYKKRPIYWLFTSGKEKAFNCLIYMHRYDKTTLSRIRTDYLHEYQIRLDGEKESLQNIIEGDSTTTEISNAKKDLKVLDKKITDLKEYDELLHHMADMQIEIDLDDGVVVNYEKFNGLVAKI